MLVRRLLIALVTLSAVMVALLPTIIESVARHYLLTLQNRLEARGARLSVTDLSGHILGISARSVELWLAVKTGNGLSFPLNLQVKDVTLSLEPSVSPRLRLRGAAYEGTLDLTLRDIFGTPAVSGKLDQVNLGSHPQLNALGLLHAPASLTIVELPVQLARDSNAQLDFGISDGSISISPDLFNLVGGEAQQIASLLKIESITSINARLGASLQGGAFVIRPMTLSSSLLSLDGQARGALDNGRGEPSVVGGVRLTLSEDSKHLQQWLPLLSDNSISADSSEFSLRFSSGACSGSSAQALRLGRLCLRGSLGP